MPIDNTIRRYIDSHLVDGLADDVFFNEIEVILLDIFELLVSAPYNAQPTASYLAYVVSRQYMRSANQAQQCRFAQRMTALLQRLYNDPATAAQLASPRRERGFELLLVLYRLHYVLTMNGLLADNGPLDLDTGDPLRALQSIIGAAYGPWQGLIQLQGGVRDYYHCRIRHQDGASLIEIGRARAASVGLELHLATWNMQGTAATAENKWRTYVLQLARRHDVLVIQEAGAPPSSAELVLRTQVADQFGRVQEVDQYLWQAGTGSRPESYQVYFLDVQRLRVNLAIVIRSSAGLDVRDVVVIADGVPESGTLPVARPALGVRLRRRGEGAANRQEVTVFNFHALSGGGYNAPRMIREISWHTDTPYVVLGDFNRDPRPPATGSGNWVSPQSLARIHPANGNTHPATAPEHMLDYALVNGTTEPVEPGVVEAPGPSDHLAVSYLVHFS
ncbi:endonuclease/exonuclease/phosphatase family protein [Pseudomonas wadenswilerensis]